MGVTERELRADAPRLGSSPWPYFAGFVAVTWIVDIAWHRQGVAHDSMLSLFISWLVMSAAMMTPTTVPMLSALADVVGRREPRTLWLFLGGYLTVWAGFSIVVAQFQLALMQLGVVNTHGVLGSNNWVGIALLGAGVYQFSHVKDRCREACMRPMKFFMVHWRAGSLGAVRMGVRHGLACLGCCVALMLLAFVGGMANWGFMALATAIMVVEKWPSLGRKVSMPLGIVLLVAGALVMITQPLNFTSHLTHTEGTLP